MRVQITLKDNTSLSPKEAIECAKHIHGPDVEVEVLPDRSKSESFIYHGIQSMVAIEILTYFFEDDYMYMLPKIKERAMSNIESILDKVISDTEDKLIE